MYKILQDVLDYPEKSCKSCLRLSLDDDERDVVSGTRPLRKLRQRRLNPIAYTRRRRLVVARDDFIQTGGAKLLTTRANRLGHTI
jgi:hypothetical protein